MRTLVIILLFSVINSLGQDKTCDTLFLTNGKKIIANIQKESSFSYTYILCCEQCSEIRKIQKKDVSSVRLSDSTVITFDRDIGNQSTISLGLELGGTGILGGPFVEFLPSDQFGLRASVGYFNLSIFPLFSFSIVPMNFSLFGRFGKKRNFVPSIGVTKFFVPGLGLERDFSVITNYYGIQKHTNFGFVRFSPGLMLFIPDKAVQPWLGLSVGFNLL